MIKGCLKIRAKIKSQSQSRSKSKTNSKGKNSNNNIYKNEKNGVNLLLKNKNNYNNYGIYTLKPKTIQEQMDYILTKNIIALTKKIRKSHSPKIKLSQPSYLKNVINPQNNLRENNFINNNSKNSKNKKKNPSPIPFKILNSKGKIECN